MLIASLPVKRIFGEIQNEHRAFTRLVTQLPVRQLDQSLPGIGRPVDVLVHVTAWQANALQVALAQAKPDAPEIDPEAGVGQLLGLDTDRFNADLRASRRGWLLDRALHWSNQVHVELVNALTAIPDGRLLGGSGPYGARRWYARPCITHPRAHREELQQLLRLT